MANIRKRDGKFQVSVRRKGFSAIYRSFHKRNDAEEWARQMESKADRGDMPTPVRELDKFKVRDILIRYRDEITVTKRSSDTESYILNAFIREKIADLRLSEVNSSHFTKYRDKRLKSVKPGTVNRELSIIKHAFDIAEKQWAIPLRTNPLGTIKKLKVNNARTRRLFEGELEGLLNEGMNSRNPHIVSLIKLALFTGMRRGEILRLKWSEIDLVSRTLHIPITKNGFARTIPISQQAMEVLLTLKENQISDMVFDLSDNAAKLAWQRLLDRTNIDDLHFHDLRHEAISRFFECGLSVPEVALISGHRDFKMLFRYTHLKPENIALKLKS